jgi:hypothetical protein
MHVKPGDLKSIKSYSVLPATYQVEYREYKYSYSSTRVLVTVTGASAGKPEVD